ncbi:MAG: NAD(P)H-dependent oxidoreductase [Rhodococcus sp.]|nr:NAD(P)H-dependent oxidoreductase [Rhodococcus sp. (in: high G+C Gram-positive bacteria)]
MTTTAGISYDPGVETEVREWFRDRGANVTTRQEAARATPTDFIEFVRDSKLLARTLLPSERPELLGWAPRRAAVTHDISSGIPQPIDGVGYRDSVVHGHEAGSTQSTPPSAAGPDRIAARGTLSAVTSRPVGFHLRTVPKIPQRRFRRKDGAPVTGPLILLVSGSLREGSINSAAIRTVAAQLAADVDVTVYDEMGVLPHFTPDVEATALPEVVARLRRSIEGSDAVLICTPEYAGALPGSFKNLLDWTVGGMEIVGKPTAWINVSANATGAAGAHSSLETVLTYTGADIIGDACRHIPLAASDLSADGLVSTPDAVDELRSVALTLLERARQKQD